MLRLPIALVFVALAAHANTPDAGASAAPANPAGPKCPAPEFRQFDFWVGDWDTFETDKSAPGSIARARIDLLGGVFAMHPVTDEAVLVVSWS